MVANKLFLGKDISEFLLLETLLLVLRFLGLPPNAELLLKFLLFETLALRFPGLPPNAELLLKFLFLFPPVILFKLRLPLLLPTTEFTAVVLFKPRLFTAVVLFTAVLVLLTITRLLEILIGSCTFMYLRRLPMESKIWFLVIWSVCFNPTLRAIFLRSVRFEAELNKTSKSLGVKGDFLS